jgi:hypothetical protein
MTGIELIAQERKEQIEMHNISILDDVSYNSDMQLSFAAAILTCPYPEQYALKENNYACPEGWDLKRWNKMRKKIYKERLIIAGALLAAEIDRLQYLPEAD